VDFTEDPDHRLIRTAIRGICARFPDEYWAGLEESHTFPWEFYDAMAKGGWIGIAIPAECGGGCGITEASIVLEEVAASGACMNGASSIRLSIFGMHPVVRHGSAELVQRHLSRVATGDLHVAFGVTEPDAGLDTTAIRTHAERDVSCSGEGFDVRVNLATRLSSFS
jgi:acyl-CoA dehydrogenase